MPHSHEFRRRSDIEKGGAVDAGAEAELRLAIESANLGIVDYYPMTGELHLSHRGKEHFGLSPDAHVNYNVFLVALHPADRGRVEELLRKALSKEREGRFVAEYRTVGIEDGRERWIAASGQAFFNGRGEAVRFIGTTRDVTEHKNADADREGTIRRLEQENRALRQAIPPAVPPLQGK